MVRSKNTWKEEDDIFIQIKKLSNQHNYAHNYIGGSIGDGHTSFRDPFVFLLHSNVDRLFAAWQLRKGKDNEFEYRLDPEKIYGKEMDTVAKGSTSPHVIVGIRTMLSPWCGIGYPYVFSEKSTTPGETEEPGVRDVRPGHIQKIGIEILIDLKKNQKIRWIFQ